ncbi:MAG: hypothetical protein JOZ47_21475 [Kutzneria sp.]|nr:hypothetical protein [Kutzneria sp.]
MSDELIPLPPHRPMPPEVKERIRERVRLDTSATVLRFSPRRAPVLAAAAVIVLIAAGAVVTASIRDTGHGIAAGPSSTAVSPPWRPRDSATTSNVHVHYADPDDLARCWSATRRSPTPTLYPDRSKWVPEISMASLGYTVVIVSADSKPIFCQLSPSKVMLSVPGAEPRPDARSGVQLLYVGPGGTLGGVIRSEFSGVDVAIKSPNGKEGESGPAITEDGIFLRPPDTFVPGSHVELSGMAEDNGRERKAVTVQLSSVSEYGLTTVVDRDLPQGERGSPEGRRLGQCLAQGPAHGVAPPDPGLWQPGPAIVVDDNTWIQTGTSGPLMGACTSFGQPRDAVFLPVNKFDSGYLSSTTFTVQGVLDSPASDDLIPGTKTIMKSRIDGFWGQLIGDGAALSLTFPNGTTVNAEVRNGIFVVPLRPPFIQDNRTPAKVIVIVRDAKGTEINRSDFPL